MAVPFSNTGEDVIQRTISDDPANTFKSNYTVEEFFEIQKCCDWISGKNFLKVVLQFPDSLLKYSAEVSSTLQKRTNSEIFILADTSYGSCCVDEISAEHVSADAVIHFGHACLSPTNRLPVLYIFGKKPVDVDNMVNTFSTMFEDKNLHIVVLYEVFYIYAEGEFCSKLKSLNENIIFAHHQLLSESNSSLCLDDELSESTVRIEKCGKVFDIPASKSLSDFKMFYIGSENQTLMNLMLNFNSCEFFTYDPLTNIGRQETLDTNKYLRKRYYYIERAKDAKIVGILLGTLGVTNYRKIVNHLRTITKEAGKKVYTIAVGKLNSAKLANFSEIEVFVYVSCTECTIIDSHQFYQPIVTPYEMEIACNNARSWTGDYVTDFSELLPGATHYVPLDSTSGTVNDVSLVTGKLRSLGKNEVGTENSTSCEVATRNKMTVANLHSNAAGEYLTNRSWKGLEQKLGETPVTDASEGQKGIASDYEGEGRKT